MGRVILGIIAGCNIAAAVLFVGCGICANVSDSRGTWHVDVNGKRVADEKMLAAHLAKEVPGYPAVKIVGIVLGYAASVGLILSGIALFFGKWWGKLVAAPIYALALFHHVAFIIYYLVWVHPAINAFFNQIPRPFIPLMPGQGGAIDPVDILIKAQSWTALWPGYVSITWWIIGILYYLLATPAVLLTPTSSADTDATPIQKPKRRGEEEEDEEEERPSKRRRKEEDNDDEPRPKGGKRRPDGRTRSGPPPD